MVRIKNLITTRRFCRLTIRMSQVKYRLIIIYAISHRKSVLFRQIRAEKRSICYLFQEEKAFILSFGEFYRHIPQKGETNKKLNAEDCRKRIVKINLIQTEKTAFKVFRHRSVRAAADKIGNLENDYRKRDKLRNA